MTQPIKLGLLGNGISHSRSKSLHELMGQLYHLEVSYQPMDLAQHNAVDIQQELNRCQQQGFRGVNVTHPYKREAFNHITTLPDFPSGLTSVNTVLFEEDGMIATNTDYSGFCHAFTNQFGHDFKPGKVMMLGTGGVGLAIAFGLQALGATELVVYDKQEVHALKLIDSLEGFNIPVRLASANLIDDMQQADGLINATPVGMYQYPGNPFPNNGFGNQRWAFDAVYTPENTEFLQQCQQHGIETLSGFKLFLYQGLDAFQHFSGQSIDAAQLEQQYLQRYPLNPTT